MYAGIQPNVHVQSSLLKRLSVDMFSFPSLYWTVRFQQRGPHETRNASAVILTGFEKFTHRPASEPIQELIREEKNIIIQCIDGDLKKDIQEQRVIVLEHINNDYNDAEKRLRCVKKEIEALKLVISNCDDKMKRLVEIESEGDHTAKMESYKSLVMNYNRNILDNEIKDNMIIGNIKRKPMREVMNHTPYKRTKTTKRNISKKNKLQ